ncbi:MAG: TonB-dependent receptor plug domain-containing protein [Tannerellaceae bacterium]|nr:TonB-dependent receptor plug domain-containing protein [Tannerellaceae bacterium]
MKTMLTTLATAFLSAGLFAQNISSDGKVAGKDTIEYESFYELSEITVKAYRLKNTSYTDSIITLGPWQGLRLLDIPFSMTTLSADAMKNLQVTSINEVSKYLPSMQIEARGGLEVGRPQTRGFQGSVVECSRLDGMNMVSTTAYPMEQFQSLEVLNGIAGSLYGPASPAGSFNYSSKRVAGEPRHDISASFQQQGIGSVHADLSRIFKDGNKSLGYRLNGLYADGEGYTEYSNLNRTFLGASLDGTIGNLAVESNLGRYTYKQYGYPGGFAYGRNITLPENLDPARQGYGQEWAGMDLRTITANLRLKYAINNRWKITAGLLSQTVDRNMFNPGITVTSNEGDYTAAVSYAAGRFKVLSNMIAINTYAKTGSIGHSLVLGTNGFIWSIYNTNSQFRAPLTSPDEEYKLSNPKLFVQPALPLNDGHYLASKNTQQSIHIGDNITINKHWVTILSASYNLIDNESYRQTGEVNTTYSDNGISFTGSLLYKPVEKMTLYGTYSDVLQQGATAPDGADNKGVVLDPYRSTQIEAGYKIALPGVDLSLAVFRMERPFPFLDVTDNLYKLQGKQANTGVEVYGDASIQALHLLGGFTYIDPKLKDTGIEATSNTQVVGVPKLQGNLFAEYKLPIRGDLSLNGNLHYTSKKAANDMNSSWIDAYTTFDLGLRYTMLFSRTRIVWNLQATNLANKKYWASIFPGDINGAGSSYNAFLGAPREIKASVRVIF